MAKKVIKFQIESELAPEYQWVINELGIFAGFECLYVDDGADITIAEQGIADIQVSHFFRSHFLHGDYQFKSFFLDSPLHYCSNGKPDYLSTCFYMLSCLQEYTDVEKDRYGRFPYEESWQYQYNCVTRNLVANYFRELIVNSKLSELITPNDNPSQVFLSHDIDTLNGAWREQRKILLKDKKLKDLVQLGVQHVKGQSSYSKLSEIMAIEEKYNYRSVFFWLTRQGRSKLGIEHADYLIDSENVSELITEINDRGHLNGLHKSAFRTSYRDVSESLNLKSGVRINRNHYLLLNLPETFDRLEAGGLQYDATLGFAEHYGFRAGYGLPFSPYNIKERRAYRFKEIPLLIMDTTFRHYLKLSPEESKEQILNFIQEHKQDCLISLLWHNNYFFDKTEPGWYDVYDSTLSKASSEGLTHYLPIE